MLSGWRRIIVRGRWIGQNQACTRSHCHHHWTWGAVCAQVSSNCSSTLSLYVTHGNGTSGVGGAMAEGVPILSIVGCPARPRAKLSEAKQILLHHTFGFNPSHRFASMSRPAVCSEALLTDRCWVDIRCWQGLQSCRSNSAPWTSNDRCEVSEEGE